jgi:hypothetical protein
MEKIMEKTETVRRPKQKRSSFFVKKAISKRPRTKSPG